MKRILFLLGAAGWAIALWGQEQPEKHRRLSEQDAATAMTNDSLQVPVKTLHLKEVVVKASPVKRLSDRFVLFMPPASGKDGVEVLQQAPGVWLSDQGVYINGTPGAKVYVDDREIKLVGEMLVAYLRSLRSDNILRIEVLPVAGADRDANAQGGIVHIFMRRHTAKGLHGNLTLGAAWTSGLQRYAPDGSFNLHNGKWDWYGSVSGVFLPANTAQTTAVRRYAVAEKNFTSRASMKRPERNGNVRAGCIFTLDTLNSIGMELEYLRHSDDRTTWSYSVVDDRALRTESEGNYRQQETYDMYAATANYVHKLDRKGSVVKLIADFTSKRSAGNNRYDIRQQTAHRFLDTLYRSRSEVRYRIATADLSLRRQLTAGSSLLGGMKYTYTGMDDEAGYEGFRSSTSWTPLPAYDYRADYRENIGAAYLSYTAKWKKWSVNAGVRGEYTRTSDRTNGLKRRYWDWFPHADLTYCFDDAQKWMIIGQYARYIERPAFAALNPNRIQTSDYSYQIGNPSLSPTYIHRFSGTLVYRYRYTLTAGGNLHRDLIREFGKQDAGSPEVSYITYENHYRENHWFVAVSVPWQPAVWFDLTTNLVGVRQCIKMYENSPYTGHFLYFGNAEATFHLPRDYAVELQYSGASRLYSGNSEVAPYHVVHLRLRKKWQAGKWVAALGIDNLFDRQNRYVSRLENYSTHTDYRLASAGRMFKVSVTWSFDRGKKMSRKRVEKNSSAERSRLEENK